MNTNKVVHYTFSTYKRWHSITSEIANDLEKIFEEICKNKCLKLMCQSILSDHVHLLIAKNRNDSNEYVMKMIKGISSHLIFKKYPSNRFVYRKLWSRGYRAFEIKDVENVNQVASYIINQKTDNIDKRFFPNWKPRRLVAGFLTGG
jgi:REP element-mobilizing transposase RayT